MVRAGQSGFGICVGFAAAFVLLVFSGVVAADARQSAPGESPPHRSLPHESLPREGQTVQSPPILGAWNGPRPPAPPRRERPDGGIDADGAWREKRGDILQRRAAQREIHRREAAQELARRGITLDDLRIMTPQERAAVLQGLREHLHARAQPGWRLRMMERRRAAQGDLEQGQMGRRHVRAQILAVDPSAAALNSARDNGFRVMRERRLSGLGVRIYVLAPPPGMPVQNALDVLRRADPAGSYDLNHVFDPSAASRTPGANGLMPGRAFDGRGVKIGVVDTGVARQHPALATARITERAFVETTGARETGHGTAIAALLVGDGDGYQGVIPGAHLFVADVFGSTGAGGSAEAIVDALAWLDVQDVDVINISLEGPPNRTLEAVINALVRRGRIIVAAVGNQGPTQPVAYPAAYDGVIGVTAIDVERRIYIAANRGAQVDFAALGVGVLTADGVGYDTVSGTSFAAPMVAATVAALSKSARLPQARLAALTARARDLGSPGRDPVYGDGAIEPGAAP